MGDGLNLSVTLRERVCVIWFCLVAARLVGQIYFLRLKKTNGYLKVCAVFCGTV